MKKQEDWVSTGNYLLNNLLDNSLSLKKITLLYGISYDIKVELKKQERLNKLNEIFGNENNLC